MKSSALKFIFAIICVALVGVFTIANASLDTTSPIAPATENAATDTVLSVGP